MNIAQTLRAVSLVLREAASRERLDRRPEPSSAMDDEASVIAFHRQGAPDGPLLPVYHFNASATSRLLPSGGHVLDLGCGSGQYLRYLASCRPDARIIGVDLSETMVAVGRRELEQTGLAARVKLEVGDMTDLARYHDLDIHCVSCVFALHHLPTVEHVKKCLREIAELRRHTGCAVWIFDHTRPRHPRTAELFPEVFTPEADSIFREDSRNSLIASHSFDELSAYVRAALGQEGVHHECSHMLRLYQVHWVENRAPRGHEADAAWNGVEPTAEAGTDYRRFRRLFPEVEVE